MAVCQECKLENREEAKFCSSCGSCMTNSSIVDSTYQKLRTSKSNVAIFVLWDVLWCVAFTYPIFIAYRIAQPSISSYAWILPFSFASILFLLFGIFDILNFYIELNKNGFLLCSRFNNRKFIKWEDIRLVGDIDYSSSFFDWMFSRPEIDSKEMHIAYMARRFSRNDQSKVASYIKEFSSQFSIGSPSINSEGIGWWREVSNDFCSIRPIYRTALLIFTWLMLIIRKIYGFGLRTGDTPPWHTFDDPIIQWGILYFAFTIAFHKSDPI